MKSFMRFLCGISFLIFGVTLLASCLSYRAADTSLNTKTTEVTLNAFGLFGSYSADLLMQLFGSIYFLIPLAFICIGIMLFTHKSHLQ